MTLKPMADNILLKQTEAEETTSSGIILATTSKEKPSIYEVISVGEDVKSIAPGNKVVVGNYTGSEMKIDGVDYRFVKLEDVLAIVID